MDQASANLNTIESSPKTQAEQIESNPGFSQAQATATELAPSSDSQPSDPSRMIDPQLSSEQQAGSSFQSASMHEAISHISQQKVHKEHVEQGQIQSTPVKPNHQHNQVGQRPVEADELDEIPAFINSGAHGRPKHPTLPADPEQSPKHGQGLNDQVYECLVGFNQWLSQQDSFIGAEMRIKLRYIKLEVNHNQQSLTFVWGGPTDLIQMFDHQKDIVITQLVHHIKTGLDLSFELRPNALQLELVGLEEQDESYTLESLTEYAKRKRARQAIQQIDQAVEAQFVQEHLDTFGGQVVYVVPQVLNQESR